MSLSAVSFGISMSNLSSNAKTSSTVSSPTVPPRASRSLSRRAADGEAVDPQGRLADADGHALAFLAAGADPRIECQVVADHADLGQHVRAVADERGALHGLADLAVLDQVGLGAGEHELAVGD